MKAPRSPIHPASAPISSGSSRKPTRAARETVAAPAPGATPGIRVEAENTSGNNPLAPAPARARPAANTQGSAVATPTPMPATTRVMPPRRTRRGPNRSVSPIADEAPADHAGHERGKGEGRRSALDAEALELHRAPVDRCALDDCAGDVAAATTASGPRHGRRRVVRSAGTVSRSGRRTGVAIAGDQAAP